MEKTWKIKVVAVDLPGLRREVGTCGLAPKTPSRFPNKSGDGSLPQTVAHTPPPTPKTPVSRTAAAQTKLHRKETTGGSKDREGRQVHEESNAKQSQPCAGGCTWTQEGEEKTGENDVEVAHRCAKKCLPSRGRATPPPGTEKAAQHPPKQRQRHCSQDAPKPTWRARQHA